MARIQSASSTLLGTSGNDTLVVGSGITSINGGVGTDTAVFADPLDWYTITQSKTGIKVKDTHTGATVTLTNVEILNFAGGTVINAAGATLAQPGGQLSLTAGGGNNTVVLGSETSTVVLSGSNNTLTLGSGADTVTMGSGNDVIKATAANLNVGDNLNGGAGINTFALSGGGTVNLAAVAQFANLQAITLDATGTTLTLGNAAETVTAAGGNNVLTLGSGVDSISLGNGNDVVKATAATLNAADHLIGGTGANVLSLTGGGTVNLAALAQFSNFQTVALDGTGTTLTLGNAAETVTAAGGNNVLTLGTGVDSVSLGNGNDVVNATAASLNAADHLIGGTGSNVLSITGGGSVNLATLAQFSNFQTVALDATGTTLTLGSTAETVTAAGGNNAVTLGSGLESVTLGAGNDIVYANGASLNAGDHIDGGGGANTLVLSGGGAVLAQFSNFQTVMLDGSGTTLTVSSDPLIVATGGNNVITLGDFANTVTLGSGNDIVTLGGGVDTVSLGGGNDIVNATAGSLNASDMLDGGTGVNTLALTGGGTINLAGVAQVANLQTVALDASGTTLTLGSAPETVTAAGGNNVITLGNGLDTVTLGAGNDTVMVGAGAANGSAINGGAGQNVAVFADAVTSYVIAPTTAGVDITNKQTGAIVHLANIGTVDFAGGAVYNVATGQLTSGTSTPPSSGTITITPGTILGTSGSDTLFVDVSTAPSTYVNGEGGNDTAVFTFGDSSWYRIVKNPDGSVDLTEVHASGHTAHLVGVGTIDFAYGTQYDVATGQFSTISQTPTGGTTTTTGGSGSTTNTVLSAPQLPQAQASLGQIVAIELQNNTGQLETGHEVTFGQVFADGDLPSAGSLIATVNGQQIPLQVDVKNTYADGSVKYAILTLKEPDITANGSVNVMLARGTPITSGPAITAQDILNHGYSEQLSLTFHNSDGTTTLDTIDVGKALAQAIANNTVQTWMQGPLATQVSISVAINPQMQATFQIKQNADGTFQTDVIVGNTAPFQPATTFNYDVQIVDHGAVAFSQTNVSQYQYSTWQKEITSGAISNAHVVYDLAYLEKTGAIPGYDPSLGVNSSVIANEASQLTAANTGILGGALVTKWMPETGGRPDIGPTTAWAANYLVSQDSTAETIMLDTANAAGAVPWNFTDPKTGEALSIQNYPNLWIDYRGINLSGTQLSTMYDTSNTGWQADTAHVASLTYDAYLLTGNPYYLSELQAQASYDIAALSPSYRGGSAGLFEASGQIRAVAWGLRDVAQAAYATPATDPLKAYYTQIVNNNLDAIYKETVGNASENATQFHGYYALPGTTQIPVYQEDFLAITIADLAIQGNAEAGQIAAYMNNFIAGRFLNGGNGFNPLNGPGYWWSLTDPTTGQAYTTWADLYNGNNAAGNFGSQTTPTSIAGNPTSGADYVAYAKASTASLFDATHSPDDLEAFSFLYSQSPTMAADYKNEQNWDITPTLLDGHHLLNTEMQFNATAGTTVTAATPDALVASTGGGDTLVGGNGTAILYALGGNNKLIGGSGMNYLFGETGSDTLVAGSADNYMKGVGNNDTFVFTNVGAGHDTVVGFVAGSDHIQINPNGASITAANLIQSATTDTAGDVVLHLGSHDITLVGIHANQLQTSWFIGV
jgi:Ca2+-binding RTX toxin-like protein